jgi:hypothetical protein
VANELNLLIDATWQLAVEEFWRAEETKDSNER